MLRRDGDKLIRSRFTNLPTAFANQPIGKGRGCIGKTTVDRLIADPLDTIRRWRRKNNERGLFSSRRDLFQRYISGLAGCDIAGHFRSEGRIHRILDGLDGAKAPAQVLDDDALLLEPAAQFLVRDDVGPAETVNRLFGISDQEEFSRLWPDGAPIILVGIIGRQ